jgi:16S rRNA (cytosine1402-N4)-methyltransferase
MQSPGEGADRRSSLPVPPTGHEPVLLGEVLEVLAAGPGAVVIDCTTGRGGHALALAQRIGPQGQLLCLDADPRNLEYARERLKEAPCQTRFFHANFAEIHDVLDVAAIPPGGVDAILADLGISTNQLFEPAYGLSFSIDMPLDMRVDPRLPQSAADIVNRYCEEDLADVLYKLAQERYSRRIAKKIVEARRIAPIKSTGRLADIVRSAMPPQRQHGRRGAPAAGGEKIDPATRTFLALRMAVNQELENLEALLKTAPSLLKPATGRFAVISFQSMEDRLVKQAFRSLEASGACEILTPKPLSPGAEELAANPRSRSAKLRAIVRRRREGVVHDA